MGQTTFDVPAGKVDGDVGVLNTKVGNLSSLTTTAKTNLVGAINEIDSDVGVLNGNITKFHAIYHKSVSKASNTANYIDTGLHGDYSIAIAAYESTGGAGAPVALGRNGNAIFAYLFKADGTAYTGAATVDVFYVLRTNIIEYVG